MLLFFFVPTIHLLHYLNSNIWNNAVSLVFLFSSHLLWKCRFNLLGVKLSGRSLARLVSFTFMSLRTR